MVSYYIYYIMRLYSDQFQLLLYIQWNSVGWKTTLTPIDFHGMDKNNEVWNDDKIFIYKYLFSGDPSLEAILIERWARNNKIWFRLGQRDQLDQHVTGGWDRVQLMLLYKTAIEVISLGSSRGLTWALHTRSNSDTFEIAICQKIHVVIHSCRRVKMK